MSAGRFVACAGGGATSLGPIELVHASFDAEDRLVQASLWVSASHAELSAPLRRAYPDYLPEPTLTSYFVNRGRRPPRDHLLTLHVAAWPDDASDHEPTWIRRAAVLSATQRCARELWRWMGARYVVPTTG